jgi:hypothetical protein
MVTSGPERLPGAMARAPKRYKCPRCGKIASVSDDRRFTCRACRLEGRITDQDPQEDGD